jgi:membrane-associated phospholipid phosphatase
MRNFVLFHILATLFLGSWLFPMTRELWDLLDEKMFYFFNGFLYSKTICWIIGILSQHITDFIFDLLMVISFFFVLLSFTRNWIKSLSMLIGYFFYELITFYTINKKLIPTYFASGRLSPSYIYDNVRTVMDKVDLSGIKLGAINCFPGDHATSFFLWAAFMFYFSTRKAFIFLAIFVSLLASLPRLFIAAHWFTDIFVGSISVVLVLFAWAQYTPLLPACNAWIERRLLGLKSSFFKGDKTTEEQ